MFKTVHDLIDIGHSRIAYWRFGSGPDLVLIHGWPLHSATYRSLLPTLRKHFTCHFFDLPGAGKTRVDDVSKINLRTHADTVVSALDQVGLTRYAMLAHDSGGVVTRAVAARRRQQVTALVLGNTEIPGRVSTMFRVLVALGNARMGQVLMGLVMRSRQLRKSKLLYGACFEDTSFCEGEFEDLFIAPSLRSPAVALLQMEMLKSFDWALIDELTDVHREIECPVQLIWGADDPWFPLAGAEKMQHDFKAGCELQVLRPGKLFVHEEQPEVFAQLAVDFLIRKAGTTERVA